jgi:asparagine synthase (glutamine-hydrolysing)
MCGIAGILNDDERRPADAEVLSRMLDRIVHRGPDDEGRLVDANLAMGMRRLSIIDLSGGHQPIFDESGRFGIVFNGEIYNYIELRRELIGRGHRFATDSDTEVIIHLYEEAGPKCVEHLRGMFAFAIWDSHTRELFIARDRLGIKPVYYTRANGALIFGSEIKSILQHPAVRPELEFDAMSHYLSLKYVPAPHTLFRGIASLPPGHCLTARDGSINIRQYWDVSFTADPWGKLPACHPQPERHALSSHIDDCEQRLSDLLYESVRIRLRSDVPFGAFLSGGIDSSLIVALMSEILAEPVKTFSVGFQGGTEADELRYAREVAQRFGCDHHEIVVRGKDFIEQAETVIWHLDQPIADQATMATFMVSRLASQHVKMVLTGEGGDELFAGYARYVGERYSRWFRMMPSPIGRTLRWVLPKLPGLKRPKIALHALTYRDEATRFANWFPLFNDDAKAGLLSREFLRSCTGPSTSTVFAEHLVRCDARDSLGRMLYVDSKLWLPDYLLLRGDKLTMANSLEGRVPLLDHRLVAFAASLPSHLKLNGKTRKYLLKKFARKLLPDRIIDRPKQGFPIPIADWLRAEAKPMLRDLLSTQSIHRRGFFHPSYVERLIREHETRFADHSDLLWGLMSLEIWQRQFLDNSQVDVSRKIVREVLA